MKVALPTLRTIVQNNVVEIKFFRRRLKPGAPATRRMLCTNSFALLNSAEGRLALNYRPTTRPPRFNPSQKDLLIVWDLFMQNYRCVNMSACNLISTIPANKEFWKYFNAKLSRLTAQQKINFMNL
ncbi:MAG: hypothetical protein EBU90_25070 [Proteobacteria bacterium]|nr:hypothetical protein [Pseudomonadota bacterium]